MTRTFAITLAVPNRNGGAYCVYFEPKSPLVTTMEELLAQPGAFFFGTAWRKFKDEDHNVNWHCNPCALARDSIALIRPAVPSECPPLAEQMEAAQ